MTWAKRSLAGLGLRSPATGITRWAAEDAEMLLPVAIPMEKVPAVLRPRPSSRGVEE